MTIRWKKTNDPGGKPLRLLVHGASGAGKTWLARTVPDPSKCVFVAIEDGALSLADIEMNVAVLEQSDDLFRLFELLEGRPEIEWIYIDSLTEWAEWILHEEMQKTTDGRKAYGELNNKVKYFLSGVMARAPQHVVATAKQSTTHSDTGRVLSPSMPGATLSEKTPVAHMFDCCWCLHVVPDGEGGATRQLQTDLSANPRYASKTRDPWGRIRPMEPANLAQLAAKLRPENK